MRYDRIQEGALVAGELQRVTDEEPGVGFLTLQELRENRTLLGLDERVIAACGEQRTHLHAGVEEFPGYSLVLIHFYKAHSLSEEERIAFLIWKRGFLLIQLDEGDEGIAAAFRDIEKRHPQTATYELLLRDCFNLLLGSGDKILDSIEGQIARMESDIVEGHLEQKLNERVVRLRNRLSAVNRYYEELVDLGETLQENGNDLFRETELRYFRRFTGKAARLSGDTHILSENLIHLREALSAALDYRLNSTMQVLTVVSVVFLPLTLIVGWYGMNFHMPELSWRYGYLFVTLLSAVTVTLCIWYFRRHGGIWPKRQKREGKPKDGK